MHFEGTTYRPPLEADNMLLQVTVGCTHNRCTYCNMYRDVRFRPSSLEEIEADLKEARQIYRHAERIFLVNGDALALGTERLGRIAARIRHYFPECTTVTMYASIRNMAAKSDAELAQLKAWGVNDLYVGLESGWDTVLQRINKGHTVAQAITQLKRLRAAGIEYLALLMLGVAGVGQGLENARRTAALLNETRPKVVWAGTLAVFAGTPMYREIELGRFTRAGEYEILEEEKALIQGIELEEVPWYGIHPTNMVKVRGILPRDKARMIATIDHAIEHFGREALAASLSRTTL